MAKHSRARTGAAVTMPTSPLWGGIRILPQPGGLLRLLDLRQAAQAEAVHLPRPYLRLRLLPQAANRVSAVNGKESRRVVSSVLNTLIAGMWKETPMMNQYAGVAVALIVVTALAHNAQAAQAEPKPQASQEASPSIEDVRDASRQKRDEDVIVKADQALHEITLKGGVDQRAPEWHFWRGASLRRLGRNKEALVALQESKIRGFN